MVSDLLELARTGAGAAALRSRSPQRFAGSARAAPIVVWNVSRACNMRCPHCYAAAGTRAGRDELSTEEGLALLETLAAHGVRVVIFSGGEPLLRPDLFDLLRHARAQGLSAHLSSNGSLIDASIATRLKDVGVGYVGVSVDGLPAFNDAYRGLPGGHAAAFAGLGHARAAGLRTGLRMTVSRANADQLDALLDATQAAGLDRFYVSHLVYSGRAVRLADEDLAPQESRALLWRLFARAEALLDAGTGPRIVTGANDSDGPLLLGWVRERHGAAAADAVEALLRQRGGNSAGEGIVAIDARGRVHPDQFWQQAVLGDVRRDPWPQVMAHPLLAKLRQRTARLQGRCGGCRHVALCRGSHRERALAATGNLWGADPACVLTDAEVQTVPAARAALA